MLALRPLFPDIWPLSLSVVRSYLITANQPAAASLQILARQPPHQRPDSPGPPPGPSGSVTLTTQDLRIGLSPCPSVSCPGDLLMLRPCLLLLADSSSVLETQLHTRLLALQTEHGTLF